MATAAVPIVRARRGAAADAVAASVVIQDMVGAPLFDGVRAQGCALRQP
jgi:hypothetical protein